MTTASNTPGDQLEPRISGTRVVFTDMRNDPNPLHDYATFGNSDIYAKDLVTGEEWAVCTDPAQQDSPDIEGDLVAWLDYRNAATKWPGRMTGPQEPYLKNLATGTETRLEVAAHDARDNLRLNRGRVFYRAGTWGAPPQVYMVDLRALGLAP